MFKLINFNLSLLSFISYKAHVSKHKKQASRQIFFIEVCSFQKEILMKSATLVRLKATFDMLISFCFFFVFLLSSTLSLSSKMQLEFFKVSSQFDERI
jgi:hypothetical protein